MIYKTVYILFYAVSLLPYRALYVLADVFSFLAYYIIRYRRGVVRRNLSTSFPEKTQREIIAIERGFYRYLGEYFVETVKMLSVSDATLAKHLTFRNVEEIESYFDKGQSCAAMLGHYNNWELLTATGKAYTRHKEAATGLIYHPLRNAVFDRLFIAIRQSKGGVCIPKKDILRHLVTFRRDNRPSLCGYISDQAPKWSNIHLWLPFLNHDTPVFTGGERIMRKMNNAVFYADMERISRGRYVCTFRLITDRPAELPEFEVTRRFFQMLEETVRRDPTRYLWSHDRWKRTHEEFDRRFHVENGHVIKNDD